MRIAMIGQKRTGSREGGIEVVVTELATRMAALGHDVTCYDRSGTDVNGKTTPTKPYQYKGVRVVPVRTVNVKGFAALTSAYAATRTALKDRPDIIHYHAEGPCNALSFATRAGIPTVATIHGLDWQRAKWGGLASRVIKRGERIAARKASSLIVLSRGVQNYFLDTYGRDTVFIPNGINIPTKRQASLISKRWGLTKDSYILFLGRIVPEKRPELLLEAFRTIHTDKHLVIAGGSSDTSSFMKEIQALAALDSRVIITGFVEGDILEELYSNAYIYVLPSDIEGMPMSLLEAMSYGCCCVTSDIQECSDVISNAGITFKQGDIASLRRQLNLLFSDIQIVKRLKDDACTRAASEYSWDSVIDRTLSIYKKDCR